MRTAKTKVYKFNELGAGIVIHFSTAGLGDWDKYRERNH